MRKKIIQYLQFTRAELRTAFGVFVIAAALFLVPDLLPHRTDVPDAALVKLIALLPDKEVPEKAALQKSDSAQLIAKQYLAIRRDTAETDGQKDDYLRIPFNPDTVSEEQWKKMGVPGFIATRIKKYQSMGGKFRKPEDVQKIYGFPPEVFAQLMPFMQFQELSAVEPAESIAVPYEGPVIDINAANLDDWKRLGFDANEIIRLEKFRTQAGGFVNPEQLYSIYGIQATHIKTAEPWLRADKNSVIKINLNTADSVTLAAHVYISDELAGAIIRYRNTTGKFYAVQEVAKVPGMYPALLEKLKPYLRL